MAHPHPLIVFCGGMIRAGASWQAKIATDLLSAQGPCETWPDLAPELLEARLSQLTDSATPQVIRTASPTPTTTTLLQQKKAKALYCFRDLRDVAASAMQASGHDWAACQKLGLLPTAVADEVAWRAQPGMLVQRYELFIHDLPTAIAQIAEHLEIKITPATAANLAQQARRAAPLKPGENPATPRKQKPSSDNLAQPNPSASPGNIGRWRQDLPAAIADDITIKYSDWLIAHGYDLVTIIGEASGQDEFCYVPHCGWLAYEKGDAVLAALREGDFESAEQAFFHRVLRAGDTFIDCGAHAGLYTKLAAPLVAPNGCVHAIEPSPHSFARLQRNTAELTLGGGQLHSLALGASDGTISFVARDAGQSVYNHVATANETAEIITVKQLTLPTFLRQNNLTEITFLKIDVEGQEFAVLAAAIPLLRARAIRTLMIEFNQENLARYGASCAALRALLAEHHYELLALDQSQFRLITPDFAAQNFSTNLIATSDRSWLEQRFTQASPAALKTSTDLRQRGAAASFQRQRLLRNIGEQNVYLEQLAAERSRAQAETEIARRTTTQTAEQAQHHIDQLQGQLAQQVAAHQKNIDGLRGQLNQIAATTEQQSAYITTISAERDRIQVEAAAARRAATAAAQQAQHHIDQLRGQLTQLAATTEQQGAYLAQLTAERDRLQSALNKLAQSEKHYVQVIAEQTNYIAILKAQALPPQA